MKFIIKLVLIATSIFLLATQNIAIAKSNANKLAKMYGNAIEDASLVEESEISTQLTVLSIDNKKLVWNENNSKILVATWKSQEAYENYVKPYSKTSDNEKYVTWVTAVPEVKEFCQSYEKKKKKSRIDKRLKQYLGLNTTWSYDVFVEMWVSPEDLFRPCTDPEINDATCAVNFGETVPVVKNIKDYKRFYQNLYYSSFRTTNGIVPWTGLGYTYDWANNKTDIGASEFIIVPNGEYEIHKVSTTAEYCQ